MHVYVVNDINSVQIFHSLVLLIQVSALEHTLMTSPILLFDIFMKLVLLISLPSCFLTSVSLAQHFLHIRLMSLVHLFWWYVDIHFTYGFGEHPSDPAVGNTLVFIFSFPCYFQASQNPHLHCLKHFHNLITHCPTFIPLSIALFMRLWVWIQAAISGSDAFFSDVFEDHLRYGVCAPCHGLSR